MNILDVCGFCLVAIHNGDTSWAEDEEGTLTAIMARVEELGRIGTPDDDDSPSFNRCEICDQMTETLEVPVEY